MSLKDLRKKIDRIDSRLLPLLNRRAGLAREVGRLKSPSAGVYDPAREEEILERVLSANPGPLSAQSLAAIWREVISACRRMEAALQVSYLGPEATFAHAAALRRFGSSVVCSPAESVAGVFREVEKGNADFGVVPIENSLEGAVTYTLDMLLDSSLTICSEIFLPVSHCLLSNSRLSAIRTIYSHPQVFGQCRRFLRERFPQAALVPAASTAQAARTAAGEKGAAALAGPLAAAVYKLKILRERIEDSAANITRFLVIGTVPPRAGRANRTSLAFALPHRSGSLHDALVPFKRRAINLTKIESRPSKKMPWEYYFFVDLEGHASDPRVKAALSELKGRVLFLKVLGSYPRAKAK
jgi:chorismate mutase/prephenate dehydratase